MMLILLVFFFFQAEDGIRDDLVTGVQTCALPISAATRNGQYKKRGRCRNGKWSVKKAGALPQREMGSMKSGALPQREMGSIKCRVAAATRIGQKKAGQIGRASCRERV